MTRIGAEGGGALKHYDGVWRTLRPLLAFLLIGLGLANTTAAPAAASVTPSHRSVSVRESPPMGPNSPAVFRLRTPRKVSIPAVVGSSDDTFLEDVATTSSTDGWVVTPTARARSPTR